MDRLVWETSGDLGRGSSCRKRCRKTMSFFDTRGIRLATRIRLLHFRSESSCESLPPDRPPVARPCRLHDQPFTSTLHPPTHSVHFRSLCPFTTSLRIGLNNLLIKQPDQILPCPIHWFSGSRWLAVHSKVLSPSSGNHHARHDQKPHSRHLHLVLPENGRSHRG